MNRFIEITIMNKRHDSYFELYVIRVSGSVAEPKSQYGSSLRIILLALFILSTFLPCYSAEPATGRKAVTVVTDDNYPPYIFRDEHGSLTGFLVDEWRLWEKKTGVKVTMLGMDWRLAQEYLDKGQADVIETIFKTTERETRYDFTPPYCTLEVPVFFHHSLSGIADIQTLNGFTIGVKAGDACIEKLTAEGITSIKEYPNYEKVVDAAMAGEIKVFCIDKDPALYLLVKKGIEREYRKAFTLYTGEFHRAVKKGDRVLLALLNDGFTRITPQEQKTLQLRWLGSDLINSRYTQYIGWGAMVIALLAVLFGVNVLILRYRIKQRTAELNKANQKLRYSDEKYRALVDNVHESIYVLQDMKITFVNIAGCRSVGLNENELIGQSILNYEPAEDHELTRQIHEDLISGKLHSNIRDRRLLVPSGEIRHHIVNSVRIEWDGKPATLNFAVDVTNLKLADEKLTSERKLLRTLIDHLPDAIYMKDKLGRKMLANKADIENIGIPEEKIIGHSDEELFPADIAAKFRADDNQVLQNGIPVLGREELMINKDGKKQWLLTDKLPLIDEEGNITGLVGIGRDISLQKEYETSLVKQNIEFQALNEEFMVTNEELNLSLAEIQKMNTELIQAKKSAEESDKLKTAFLANISHEIRTPLNGIMGFSEQMSDPGLSISDRQTFSTLISESGQRLTAVINDIVDISLLQTHQAKLSTEPTDLVDLVRETSSQFTESARQLGLTLTTDLPSEPMIATTDGKRLSQIIGKLLDNALKFTPLGGITVGLRRDKNMALFYVRDTGIGISSEVQEAIFNPFRQADIDSWKNISGQGLGLSIVRGFVSLMGGRIWLSSSKNEGSTFWISIPAMVTESSSPQPKQPESPRRNSEDLITILAAEDEHSNLIYLETILSKGPYKLIHAVNGAEAIALLDKNPEVSLILMDIKMPVMDGLTAFKIIRQTHPEIPVVALTAFAMADEAIRIKQAGFNEYLTKPYKRADLLKLIERLV
ncbi:MAG TPA: hypothetical protein DCR43_03640 [Bacteroidales bacterium]|nr:MAG: hypothetical protein A2X11_00335 [Bacteroidetes bacterium GWE2_42_24]OFY27751.1 MAG: hypothetical protein A2X09_02565 [Bacteroidetes bacterium GWF2_43_11]HAQ64936.1 hypothetical protein [Bacteroidales bacterium]HBZ66109.1 hypothetical protein [Bacteroidales bacterium]